MKLIGFDFETANSSLCSACQLGIVIYENGELLDSYSWLIKPHKKYLFFTNTFIHGIDLDDVKDEKEFYEYYEELSEILKDGIIVAHNASFDIGVLNAICDLYGLDRFLNQYVDTVKISRRAYPELVNHKLNTVCDYLNIELNHHEALSDATGCLLILVMTMSNYYMEDDLEGLLDRFSLKLMRNK